MQVTFIFTLMYLLSGWLCQDSNDICFQSNELKNLNLFLQKETFFIRDDLGKQSKIRLLKDSNGIIYWHRRLETPVCLTGECKLINIGIYWHFNGDFLGLEVYGEHLTKTDHSIFSSKEYDKLMTVLQNDWSILREYEREGLLDENYKEIDSSSGATKKEIANETVTGAVYTTYTIWHLIHQGEKAQLILLTLEQLEDPKILEDFIKSGSEQVLYFLFDQLNSENLKTSPIIESKVLNSINSTDIYLSNLAFKSLSRITFNTKSLQQELALIYENSTISEKQKILTTLNNISFIVPELYNILAKDLNSEKEWFSAKILSILRYNSRQQRGVIEIAKELSESKSTFVSQTATDFLTQFTK